MWLSVLAYAVVAAVALPVGVLTVECIAALLPIRKRAASVGRYRPRIAVIVPAHNEEIVIGGALATIIPDLEPNDRLLVIAHNCTDQTCVIARRYGADVLEVEDDGSHGKPGALSLGLQTLDSDPPEVVVIIDADCIVEQGSIDVLARMAFAYGGPVQGTYLIDNNETALGAISAMAVLVKNFIRPLGLYNLRLPCLLNGSGVACPFHIFRNVPHGMGSIAEDYQLTIDLALKGHFTEFIPKAMIRSSLPSNRIAAYRQRKRWEHGHLQLVTTTPGLIFTALRRRSARLFTLALDVFVPPLTLIAIIWLLSCVLAFACYIASGYTAPAVAAAVVGTLLLFDVCSGWIRYAGWQSTIISAWKIPLYVAWKAPLYVLYAFKREKSWKKTPRFQESTIRRQSGVMVSSATRSGGYCLITPCRNEESFARITIESILQQTVRPRKWIIVDDGSTDQTPAILAQYAERYDWIEVIRRDDRGSRSVGPGVVDAFYDGLARVDLTEINYLCKLDLDVKLPPTYFATLMSHMEAEPRLGTCSGKPYYPLDPTDFSANAKLVPEICGDDMSVGMTKFYRVDCFLEIGGFVREVMWDGIDCHRCRMLGWIAGSHSDPELRFIHLRPMGSSQLGILHGRRRHGFGQYFMGTTFAYVTLSAIYRMTKPPLVVGGIAMWWGYVMSAFRGLPKYPDKKFRRYVRRFQREVLLLGKSRALRRSNERSATLWESRHGPHFDIRPPTTPRVRPLLVEANGAPARSQESPNAKRMTPVHD